MNTIKFFFKSLKENICILLEEQKWWFAVIILIVSLTISVSTTLSTGYGQNVSGVINTSSDAAVDRSLTLFAESFKDNSMDIVDHKLVVSGADFTKNQGVLNSESAANNVIEPNIDIKYTVNGTEKSILYIYIFPDFNAYESEENTNTLTAFMNKSIYKMVDQNGTQTPSWTPTSFLIFTQGSVHMASFNAVTQLNDDGSTNASASALATASGIFNGIDNTSIDSLFVDDNDNILNTPTILSNFTDFLNKCYDSIKIPTVWATTGIYFAINFAIIFLAGAIFWMLTRKKELADGLKFNFWQSCKVSIFESTTPSIIACLCGLFMGQYSSFILLIIMAFRISSSISKLTKPSVNNNSDTPVYKARS